MSRYVIGVDVGTGSVRAGLFDLRGTLRASAVAPIQMWKPQPGFAEQSSEDIWRSVGTTVRQVILDAEIVPEDVVGLSYDATCSLVVLDKNYAPLSINVDRDPDKNIIVWMDHRALAEAEAINAGGYEVLKYVGGRISPEMETPKLLWLKNNLPHTFHNAGKFLDLADFLTYRSTGKDTRSLCTTVCKWTYLGHEGADGRWDADYFRAIGLEELPDARIGTTVRPMGEFLGHLTSAAAKDLGLTVQCAVGVGSIDAHAGGLGLLGAIWQADETPDTARLETALALIGGTSNCHMAVSREPKFIVGIWGPYFGAMVPGMWLTEGGQSAAGSAIDHVIGDHALAPVLRYTTNEKKRTVYEILNELVASLASEAHLPYPALLTRSLHLLPDFLGNRSPLADPRVLGMIDGLTLDETLESLAVRYYAAIQGVAYGTRDIVRAMNESGYAIDTLFVTGGGAKNPLWLQEHADATGLTLILPREPEAVLLGSAILAACAAGIYSDIPAAMQAMSGRGTTITPDPAAKAYHDAKFDVFRSMYREQARHREIMANFLEL